MKALNQLRLLPDDLFLAGTPWKLLKENIRRGELNPFYGIDLSSLRHRLLLKANSIVDSGFNSDRYQAASRSAGRQVYEVRDHASGCRGAMVLDDDGNPWLVYAGLHDWSDAKVAAELKKSRSQYWMPTDEDMGIRRAEDAWLSSRQEAVDILDSLVRTIHDALQSPNEVSEFAVSGASGEAKELVQVEVISFKGQDLPIEQAGTTDAFLNISIQGKGYDYESRQRLKRAVSYLKPKDIKSDIVREDGSVYMEVILSEAVVTQLFASVCLSPPATRVKQLPPIDCDAQPVLHYIDTTSFDQGMISGKAALSLCGVWFIPREDESSGKPICRDCEKIRPIFAGLHPSKG
ncbi:DUF3039 domain-containing protein [Bifidobacterium sp. ESL0769]|uniref:DUF3039 domain-containing protein n=1 Tax=Bifidobacterium sp. ESL0769 TaxID=2983229 RepID=UPI0023FA445F|nr:DUF3039 domain-containing protein [Bifidobacterium sp. ESL0769]WEV67363.1 DUF3039 domain-containing protein [Bifidobacterium sp. ESL0769]